MKQIFQLVTLLLMLSCNDDPNKFFELGGFRVLALTADTPEIDGVTSTPTDVTITPYVSDVNAKGRLVSLKIFACIDPGLDLGIEPSCNQNGAGTQLIAYANASTSTLGPRFTGALPPFTVTVPPGLLNGQNSQNKFNGVSYLVTVQFRAGDDEVNTYKRIVVSERAGRNTNPKIDQVLLNNDASAVLKNNDKLSVSIAVGFDEQNYQVLDADGNTDEKKEVYTVSWFSYHGSTDLSRSFLDEKNTFELDQGKTNPFIVAVLRDDQGGINVQLHE